MYTLYFNPFNLWLWPINILISYSIHIPFIFLNVALNVLNDTRRTTLLYYLNCLFNMFKCLNNVTYPTSINSTPKIISFQHIWVHICDGIASSFHAQAPLIGEVLRLGDIMSWVLDLGERFTTVTQWCHWHLRLQGGSAQTIAQQEVELFIMVVYGRNCHVEDDEKNPLTS